MREIVRSLSISTSSSALTVTLKLTSNVCHTGQFVLEILIGSYLFRFGWEC